jgi:TolA-binding protein
MQGDIFNLQTRLLTLERELADTSKETKGTADSATKRIASTRAEIERLSSELQRVRGDMDAVRVGVVTGRMPGTDPAQEGTVAATLTKLEERLASLEQTQEEILEAISKAGVKKNTKKPASRKPAASLTELQESFEAKKYKMVTEDAPRFIKEGEAKEKTQARYLLAESYFKLGDMRIAALKYNEFLESNPPKNYLPLVKMRLGDCFRNLGDAGTAKIYYEELIKEFPNSNEASKAKERLAEIGGGGGTSKG